MGLTAFGFFFCHGDTRDEIDEAVAVGLGRDGGDLGAVVFQAFVEMLDAFDESVLWRVSMLIITTKFCASNSRGSSSQSRQDNKSAPLASHPRVWP